jgi:hypothetical protein
MFDRLCREQHGCSGDQRFPTGLSEANQKDTRVCPGRVTAHVGEVQILGDQKPVSRWCIKADLIVVPTDQILRTHRIHVMAEFREFRDELIWQIPFKFDLQRLMGNSGTGRSSSAECAAKATAARTSSSDSVGKSARISAVVAPSARLASTVRSVTRVPLKTGSPPTTSGFRTIR